MPNTEIRENIPLAPFTTIHLGGNARFFAEAHHVNELLGLLKKAQDEHWRIQILGGGSNTLFSDAGFDGLVIHLLLRGSEVIAEDANTVTYRIFAGEPWNAFVNETIGQGLSGIEALAGIPGTIGATPIQNVGAYGQEVAETISAVHAIDRKTFELITFSPLECGFGYRKSRFKHEDADRYIITAVDFALKKGAEPIIAYPQLSDALQKAGGLEGLTRIEALKKVRDTVLSLRKSKSMIVDEQDPNSVSCGSFFTNPILSEDAFHDLLKKIGGNEETIPHFKTPEGVKIPAAWLLEQSGFKKGYTKGEVGLSQNHTLALVNRGGTTRDVLDLQKEIQDAVFEKFGVQLEREPVFVE